MAAHVHTSEPQPHGGRGRQQQRQQQEGSGAAKASDPPSLASGGLPPTSRPSGGRGEARAGRRGQAAAGRGGARASGASSDADDAEAEEEEAASAVPDVSDELSSEEATDDPVMPDAFAKAGGLETTVNSLFGVW